MPVFGRLLVLLSLCVSVLSAGCGEDTPSAEKPPAPQLKDFPSITLSEKAFSADQRALPLDFDDLKIIGKDPSGQNKNTDINPESIAKDFGRVVLNIPIMALTNYDAQGCTDQSTVPDASMKSRVERLISEMTTSGITPSKIAINVELVKYENAVPKGLIYACSVRSQGQKVVPFGSIALREFIVSEFRDLAGVEKVSDITFGLALNRFYLPEFESEVRLRDDYANLASLYQEVYAAVKSVNKEINVGPGFNWSVFQRSVVPEVASQRLAEAPVCSADETEDNSGCPWFMTCSNGRCVEDAEADPKRANDLYAAYERSIRPFLAARSFTSNGTATDSVTADYIALQLVSDDQSGEPFLGVAYSEDPERRAALQDWYAPIKYIVEAGDTPLKVVVSQMDWAGNQYGAKEDFLKSIKEVLSNFDLHWVAWRRSVAIPISCIEGPGGGMICPCGSYQKQGYNEAYCLAGLIPEAGVGATSGDAYRYFIAD